MKHTITTYITQMDALFTAQHSATDKIDSRDEINKFYFHHNNNKRKLIAKCEGNDVRKQLHTKRTPMLTAND